MHGIKNIAIRAARKAGAVVLQSFQRLDKIQVAEKGICDYVSDVDKKSERVIIDTILQSFPSHNIIAEESGTLSQNSDITWIVDPLDGTNNFIHGIPHFAISIAIQIKNQIEHGVIYDPICDELFSASRGSGAQLNHQRIRVSTRTSMQGALIGSGLPLTEKSSKKLLDDFVKEPNHKYVGIRLCGAATLDLAYVAAARLDGYWQMPLKIWDMAAGSLLIQEAGGLASNFQGQESYLEQGQILVGNPKIYQHLLKFFGDKLSNHWQFKATTCPLFGIFSYFVIFYTKYLKLLDYYPISTM